MKFSPVGNDVSINKLFYKLQNIIPNTITLKTHTLRKVEPIDENSTVGEQIRYYRRLANIKQKDLALKLGYKRGILHRLENEELKIVNINLFKDIIEELQIADKIHINDEYIAFLLDNPSKVIFEFRNQNHLTVIEFAKMLSTVESVVRNWENGKTQMTRKSYEKFKKLVILYKNDMTRK